MESTDFAALVKPVAEAPPWLKCLFYGPPGVGKTVLAARAPSPLLIDTEQGSRSLLNHEELRDIPVLRIKQVAELSEFFWHLKEGGFPDRETIIIDTISELQSKHLDELLRAAHAKDASRNPYLPYQGDYKENTEFMSRLVVQFRDLDRNLIITAHASEREDQETGITMWRPAVTPKFGERLIRIMDLVGYMTQELQKEDNEEIVKRTLQVHPSRRIYAKTRIGGLPRVLSSPTFEDLLKANAEFGKVNVHQAPALVSNGHDAEDKEFKFDE